MFLNEPKLHALPWLGCYELFGPRGRRFARTAQRKSRHIPHSQSELRNIAPHFLRFPIGIIGKHRSEFVTFG